MAITVSNPKFSSHARSISLPSSSHPLISSAEEHLRRLKSSGDASSSSHTLACQKLNGLKNLYECVDDALQLPLSQVLTHERSGKWEEELLDGSLWLLDICGAVRDIYSQMKERVHELESSLRRKRGGELHNEVGAYMISKRHLNKLICKCYKEMKKTEKNCSLAAVKKDSETVPLVNLIKEIQEFSVTVLESTLSLLSPSKAGSPSSRGWSLVSKLLQQKRASSEGDSDIPEIQKIEVDLHLLNNKKPYKDGDLLQMQNVLKRLEEMDSNIQELAQELDDVFRLLLKTRVSLLNILNN